MVFRISGYQVPMSIEFMNIHPLCTSIVSVFPFLLIIWKRPHETAQVTKFGDALNINDEREVIKLTKTV